MEFSSHEFLKNLPISETTHCYLDGINDQAHGEVIQTINPHTGNPIANAIKASVDDYKKGL